MNKLLSIIEDNSGGLSSTRILMLIWGIGVLVVWMIASIKTFGLVAIPESVITTLLGMGALKTVQRFGEKTPESSDPNNAPKAS